MRQVEKARLIGSLLYREARDRGISLYYTANPAQQTIAINNHTFKQKGGEIPLHYPPDPLFVADILTALSGRRSDGRYLQVGYFPNNHSADGGNDFNKITFNASIAKTNNPVSDPGGMTYIDELAIYMWFRIVIEPNGHYADLPIDPDILDDVAKFAERQSDIWL